MRAALVGTALLVLLAPDPARAQPAQVANPVWLKLPVAEDLARRFPEIAQVMNIEGRSVALCKVKADGQLTDCVSVSAQPAGLGFEQATLALTTMFRMSPRDAGGQAVAGREVRIPLRFALPKWPGDPPPPPALIEGDIPQAAQEIVRRIRAGKRMGPDPEPALLKIEQAGGGGADPSVLTDGMAAVRLADAESQIQWRDAIARAIATRLSPADLDTWLSALDAGRPPEGVAGQLATGQDPVFKAMMADAQRRLGVAYVVRIREIFCRARDCGPQSPP